MKHADYNFTFDFELDSDEKKTSLQELQIIQPHTATAKGIDMDKFRRMVKIFFNAEFPSYGSFYCFYQKFIDAAIFNDNFEALESLWKGYCFLGPYDPDYNHDVYFAAEHGSQQMFQHILWSKINIKYVDQPPLNVNKIRENAAKNKLEEVRIFVDKFFLGINDEISIFSESLLRNYKKNYEKIQNDTNLKKDLAMDIFYVEVMLERVRTLCV